MPYTGGSERNRNAGARPSAAAPRPRPPSRAEEAACGGVCSSSAILRPVMCPARGCPQLLPRVRRPRKETVPERLPGRVWVCPRASAEADGEPGGTRLLDVSPAPGGCIWAFAQGLRSLGAFCERGPRVTMTSAPAGSVLPRPGCSARSPGCMHGAGSSHLPRRSRPALGEAPGALEKDAAPHSSVPAWRIPGTEEPGGLRSTGAHRVKQE